ncbi:hypothetical protein A2U01_0112271, partial [Trifolium medium]|nr:hypothetical protein [Trifolium medium]
GHGKRGGRNASSGGEATVMLANHGIVRRLALSTSPFRLLLLVGILFIGHCSDPLQMLLGLE